MELFVTFYFTIIVFFFTFFTFFKLYIWDFINFTIVLKSFNGQYIHIQMMKHFSAGIYKILYILTTGNVRLFQNWKKSHFWNGTFCMIVDPWHAHYSTVMWWYVQAAGVYIMIMTVCLVIHISTHTHCLPDVFVLWVIVALKPREVSNACDFCMHAITSLPPRLGAALEVFPWKHERAAIPALWYDL